MIALRLWEPLIITVIAESTFTTLVLVYLAKGHRIEYFFKSIATIPIRYTLVIVDAITMIRFLFDLFIFKDRSWRK